MLDLDDNDNLLGDPRAFEAAKEAMLSNLLKE